MEFNKKQPAFIYLDKNGFYFFEEGLANIVSLAFLDTSVKDMDVINASSLLGQIKAFTEQYQLSAASITVILSPHVTFEKDITNVAPDALVDATKNFVDTIPFETVMAKSFPIQKGVKVIGFNEDLYIEIKISFEKFAFTVDQVVPYQMIGSDQALLQTLTKDTASQLLKRLDRLKQFSLLPVERDKPQQSQSTTTSEKSEAKPKKINMRLIAMAVVFIVLFVILGFMILNMGKQ